jgi:hypothetical protein
MDCGWPYGNIKRDFFPAVICIQSGGVMKNNFATMSNFF